MIEGNAGDEVIWQRNDRHNADAAAGDEQSDVVRRNAGEGRGQSLLVSSRIKVIDGVSDAALEAHDMHNDISRIQRSWRWWR